MKTMNQNVGNLPPGMMMQPGQPALQIQQQQLPMLEQLLSQHRLPLQSQEEPSKPFDAPFSQKDELRPLPPQSAPWLA